MNPTPNVGQVLPDVALELSFPLGERGIEGSTSAALLFVRSFCELGCAVLVGSALVAATVATLHLSFGTLPQSQGRL